ncbi:class D sortase [Brochothrix thermosphacta]|uniref:class D sortase n=1 Tax=Brochothrix thermosphacta TaxID=2756 RepID=UPI000D798194|nr:class D sortase [Brochothrix thermosphacta]SPN75746.1 Putative sortase [Brochothrix thermosphacta]
MKKIISIIIIVLGLIFVGIAASEYFSGKKQVEVALADAEKIVDKSKQKSLTADTFSYEIGDVFGLLKIPSLDETLPIIEGTDYEMLDRGVGHYETTKLPGQKKQILFSGHRNTVFTKLGDLKQGDRFVVEMPYGNYEYELKSTEIVDANDLSVIRDMDEELLTLSTCYPFSFIGDAPDRYIVYATPIVKS